MYRIFAVLAAFIAFLVFTSSSFGWYSYLRLSQAASIFSMKEVEVRCYDGEEDGSPSLYGAWGYVEPPLAPQTIIHIEDDLCSGALLINEPNVEKWRRSLGVLVIVHEAYHLRRWGGAGSERKVECKAIRHWKVAARILGATEETIDQLWPYALTQHYILADIRSTSNPDNRIYFDPLCIVPPLDGK